MGESCINCSCKEIGGQRGKGGGRCCVVVYPVDSHKQIPQCWPIARKLGSYVLIEGYCGGLQGVGQAGRPEGEKVFSVAEHRGALGKTHRWFTPLHTSAFTGGAVYKYTEVSPVHLFSHDELGVDRYARSYGGSA